MTINVLAFAGSLRENSVNKKLLRAAEQVAPAGMSFEYFDLIDIPLYNDDVYQEGFPAPVTAFREKIAAADALLVGCPEYNHSISGVLKNAIDWASRPPDHPFDNKAVAVVGASPGNGGTTRAQEHFRSVAAVLNMHVVNRPELLVGFANSKFDDDGTFNDEAGAGFYKDVLTELMRFAEMHKAA